MNRVNAHIILVWSLVRNVKSSDTGEYQRLEYWVQNHMHNRFTACRSVLVLPSALWSDVLLSSDFQTARLLDLESERNKLHRKQGKIY
jgi:hypothetical protein